MSKISAVDDFINVHSGWQKDNLIIFRELLQETFPNIEEQIKWSCPVFLVNGKLLFAMSIFKDHSKYNFFTGASLKDTHKIFNSGLESKKHRSINLAEGEKIDKTKLIELIKEAVNN